MYGNTFFDEEVPKYNSTKHHKLPRVRGLEAHKVFDDGTAYKFDTVDEDGSIIRGKVPSIVNIETMMVKTLRVYLYGVTELDDQMFTLEVGKRYAITYLSEQGCRVADGYLRYLDTSIPEDCTKYIGDYSSTAAQAFIGMDCSSKGVSDKRKIYIASIRGIEVLDDDDDYTAPAEDDDTKKYTLLDRLDNIIAELENGEGCDYCDEVSEKIDLISTKVDELKDNRDIYLGTITTGDTTV
jgi:hypothetical protein